MTGEPDNLPDEGGTDNAALSEYDNPETWTYFDPEEDNEEAPEVEGTDDEPGEVVAEEVEDQETVEEADEDEPEAVTATADAVVQMDDGTTATVKDLISGNMRQADYTRKSQEVANARKAVEADATRIESITEAFVEHLSQMVPQEPDPALALTDATKYTQQKAQYDAAIAQVQRLIEIGNQPKEIKGAMSEADTQKTVAEENQKLADMFPETRTQDGRTKFFGAVQSVANEIGYSTEELQGVTDHRLFALAHWAKRGMDAGKAAAAAKAKAEKAPPATPRKPGQPAKQANRNAEAMRKLSRSGSIHDAVAVDWD